MPFPSSKKSHFQNEAKYKNFLLKTRFFSPRIKNHSLISGFTLGRDCETVRIFAYSSARKQSNKMSWARLKRESETGRDARHSRVWNSYATDWKKNRLFYSPYLASLRQLENGLFWWLKMKNSNWQTAKLFKSFKVLKWALKRREWYPPGLSCSKGG